MQRSPGNSTDIIQLWRPFIGTSTINFVCIPVQMLQDVDDHKVLIYYYKVLNHRATLAIFEHNFKIMKAITQLGSLVASNITFI